MKQENLQKQLIMALTNHKSLIMDLGDNVLLHMKWEKDIVTPDGVKGCYVDEMGMTSMELILQIIKGEVKIQGKKVQIMEDI